MEEINCLEDILTKILPVLERLPVEIRKLERKREIVVNKARNIEKYLHPGQVAEIQENVGVEINPLKKAYMEALDAARRYFLNNPMRLVISTAEGEGRHHDKYSIDIKLEGICSEDKVSLGKLLTLAIALSVRDDGKETDKIHYNPISQGSSKDFHIGSLRYISDVKDVPNFMYSTSADPNDFFIGNIRPHYPKSARVLDKDQFIEGLAQLKELGNLKYVQMELRSSVMDEAQKTS